MSMGDEWKARADQPFGVPLLRVKLTEQLERLRRESTWRTSGHNAITLIQEPGLRLVLMLLGKGSRDTRASSRRTPDLARLEWLGDLSSQRAR
jgi:hypothetical protein